MSEVITLHPGYAKAINDEMRRYEQREIRLLMEISNLHKTIGGIRVWIESGMGHCVELAEKEPDLEKKLALSCLSVDLRRALELVNSTLPKGVEL